jgi:hypothetical protein
VTYLGVAVNLQDRNYYSEIEFYDLCQLLVIHTEEAKRLAIMLNEELEALQSDWAELDVSDEFTRFQVHIASLEFEYTIALRWLQLARWHQADFYRYGFYCGQTRITVNDRVVAYSNKASDIRDRARRAGVSVHYLQSLYA